MAKIPNRGLKNRQQIENHCKKVGVMAKRPINAIAVIFDWDYEVL